MLRRVPVFRDQVLAFLACTHRHHPKVLGYIFAVGLAEDDGRLCAVAIAGRPVSRALQDGRTIEVLRVATEGQPNACSMLYGACWRVARELGWTRAVTYTQDGESGASLRASGWTRASELPARTGWDTPSRRRASSGADGIERYRWELQAPGYATAAPVHFEGCGDDTQPALDLGVA